MTEGACFAEKTKKRVRIPAMPVGHCVGEKKICAEAFSLLRAFAEGARGLRFMDIMRPFSGYRLHSSPQKEKGEGETSHLLKSGTGKRMCGQGGTKGGMFRSNGSCAFSDSAAAGLKALSLYAKTRERNVPKKGVGDKRRFEKIRWAG